MKGLCQEISDLCYFVINKKYLQKNSQLLYGTDRKDPQPAILCLINYLYFQCSKNNIGAVYFESLVTPQISAAGTYAWMPPEVIKTSTFSKAGIPPYHSYGLYFDIVKYCIFCLFNR